MRRVVIVCLAAMVIFVAACDPGMTIRQAKRLGEVPDGERPPSPQVAIDIATDHPFIGHTWYGPQVRITNWFDLPITVTSIDLIARGDTYANKPPQPGLYPLVLLPRSTAVPLVWFDLNADVKKTFQKPARLRVHYRRDGKEEIATTSLVGGPPGSDAR